VQFAPLHRSSQISAPGGPRTRPCTRVALGVRISVEQAGYTFVANIGNNLTDLNGGHAERTFNLPDYNGTLS